MKRLFSLLPIRKKTVLTGAARGVRNRAIVESLEQRIAPANFTVTSIADSGVGSLRQAITDANALTGTDNILFGIVGPAGVFTIQPVTPLPEITEAVLIDGYSQSGATTNTLAVGSNAVLLVALDGALQNGGHGLVLGGAGGSVVRGLVISGFHPGVNDNGDGIAIHSSNNTIIGNFIGTNAAGTASAGNANSGVYVGLFLGTATYTGNRIGGSILFEKNLISGNSVGITLTDDSSGTQIMGNLIGTDKTGTAAIANTQTGIVNGGTGTVIGGGSANSGNVISGNNNWGINTGGTNTSIQGNLIGVNATGTAALPNTRSGVNFSNGATTARVGGSTANLANVISGNGQQGIEIGSNFGDGAGNNITVDGNKIGVGSNGTTAIGNGLDGIGVFATSGATITNNIIANNGGAGVLVNELSGPASAVLIRVNSIFNNTKLGIDLQGPGDPANGVTPNDTGDGDTGPNGLQNYPVIGSVTATQISGTLNSAASASYTVDFFTNTAADASGFGEGRTYLGQSTVNTNASGAGTFNFTAAIPAGTFVTATATSATNSTSEFSSAVQLAGGSTFIWDAGAGADTSWFNPLNWNFDSGVPGAADTAILQTNATITLATNASVGTFQQSTGTFTGAATLTAVTFVWSGGVQGGFGTTQVSSTLNLANTGGVTLGSGGNTARTLINNGVATLSGGNLLISTSGGGFSGSSFINNGTFNVTDGADISVNSLGGSPGSFSNPASAIFNKSGAGTVTTFAVDLNNAGTVNVNSGTLEQTGSATISGTVAVGAGATLRTANNFSVQAAATLSGAGTLEVTGGSNVNLQSYALTGAVVLQGGLLNFTTLNRTLPTLTQSGGTLFGSGTLTVSGALAWSGGTQNGGGTTIANGALDLTNAGGLNLGQGGSSQRTLMNNAVATLSGGNLILVSIGGATPGSQFVNNGTFNVTDGADISAVNFGGPAPLFSNAAGGIFNKSGAGTVTTFSAPLSNAGTINVNSGTLESSNSATITGTVVVSAGATLRVASGTFSVAAGATLSGAGTLAVASGTADLQSYALTGPVLLAGGTLNFNALNPTLAALTQSDGLLTGSGTITVTGAMVWNSGFQGGTGTTIANGTLALTKTGTFLNLGLAGNTGRTLVNNGTATLAGGNFSLGASGGAAPGSQFINNGTFSVADGSGIVLEANGGTAPLFVNAAGGIFNKSGTGTTTTVSVPVINAGTINVNASGLRFDGTFAQSGGATVLSGGGALFTSSVLTFNGGELRGVGSITGNVNNTGATVRPGGTGAAGTIMVEGYTQGAGGTLAVELGGTGAGQFDVLNVTGPVTLGGTLNIAHINAFTPTSGQSFRVVQSVVNPGTFATLTGASAGKTQTASATGLVLAQQVVVGSTFIWDAGAGADTSWFTAANWSPDGVPGAGDTAILNTASTINLATNTTVGTFTQSVGTLTGAATLTVQASLNWTGGAETGSGITSLASGGTGTIGGTLALNSRTLNNSGSLVWTTAGALSGRDGAAFNNFAGATFDLRADGAFQHGNSGANTVVTNAGTILKTAGAGAFTFATGNFTNTGTVRAATGTIAFPNAVSAGGTFEATTGALTFTGTTTLAANVAFNNIELAGGALVGTGTIAGNWKWSGGSILNATVSIPGGGVVNLIGSGDKGLSSAAITNSGTFNHSAGQLVSVDSSTFNNAAAGVYDLQGDVSLVFGNSGANLVFTNAGLFKKSAGAGTGNVATGNFVSTGTVRAESGTIAFPNAVSAAGTFRANPGATLNFTGTTTLNTAVTFDNIDLAGGTLTGAGTVTGNWRWSSGTLSGATLTLPVGGVLTLPNSSNKSLIGSTVNNSGTVALTGTGALVSRDAPVFNNLAGGLVDFSSDASLLFGNSGANLVFNNSGTVQKSGGTGTTTLSTGNWVNNSGGLVRAQAGTINFSGPVNAGGTFTAAGGALTLTGATTLASSVNFNGVDLAGGTLTGAGTVTGNWSWSGGAMNGATLTLPVGGVLTLPNSSNKSLIGSTVNNSGTVALTGTGALVSRDAPVFNNLAGGLVDFSSDASLLFGNSGANLTLNNAGTLRKTGGTGTSAVSGTFTNTGTVLAQTGTLTFTNFTQTAGAMVLGGGALGGTTFALQGGELRGVGTINGSVNNTGAIVRPGGTNAAGTLAITGTFTQGAGGTLAVEIGGTGAGQFDVLNVTGPVTLGGTLNIAHINAFTPTSGQSFRVVQSVLNPGTFATLTGASAGKTQTASATGLVLAQAASSTFIWDAGGGANTSWFTAANWSPDGVPGAGDTAILNTNATITLPSSTSVGTFIHLDPAFVGSNSTLTIPTGSTLTVLNEFQWDQGGTENGAGTLVIAAGATWRHGQSSITSTLSQRTINIQGSAIFPNNGFGNIVMSSGATINNSGVMDFQGTFIFSGTGAINNLAGATLKNTTSNHTVIISSGPGVAFTNAGTVRAEIGTLGFNGGYVQTAGSSQMLGGILNIGFSPLMLNGGELIGTGAFAGNLTNNGGVIRPGGTGAIGTITTNGNYIQGAGGTLETELSGAGTGQFDVFSPGGVASLAGALTAPLLSGFTPAAGDQFRVLTVGSSVAGTFTTTPAGLTTQYNAQNVTLLVPTGTSPFVVTTTLDTVNANDGVISLREAITAANSTAGTDTITFNIPGGGVKTITVASALPTLTEAAIIDGYSQPGSSANTLASGNNAVLNVVLRGASSTLGNGLTISSTAGGTTVRGLVIQNFTDGIAVNGANALIAGNWIGVSQSGTAAAGNGDEGIQVGASNVTIGGTTPAARNVISGNSGSGIEMTGGFTNLNVQGNFIGTNAAGSAAVANAGDGISLLQGANGNTIGGLTAAARNVISGNASRGVLIFSDTNVVQGNYIGTNAGGLSAVKNGFDGLTVAAPGSNNVIGGSAAGAGNVISGNDVAGVTIESINASPNPATGNRVQGNLIGVAADGVTPLGNTAGTQKGWGVAFFRNATDNIVGGAAAGEANTIANNAGAGIAVLDAGPVGNRISANSIFANGDLGIDLGAFADPANSVLANDTGDADSGPNNLLNYPVLTAANGTQISGTYNGVANQSFTIEFFTSTTGDASGFGEGRTFLGASLISTDSTGNGSFSFPTTTLSPGTPVSATATQAAAGTSEFSRFIVATGGASSIVVTTALDVVNANDRVVSLREAITFANGNSGLDTITFAIPGTGVQTIALTSALPTITDPVKIDGYTQTGATVNTNGLGLGTNAVLRIELNGAGAGAAVDGLTITAGGSTVQGLVINRFGGDGILLSTLGGNSILGNFIGTNATGSAALGNLRDGVEITSGTANRIGDGTGAGRNVISGNGTVGNNDIHNGAGVGIFNSGTNANIVSGNFIGTNATGLLGLGNTKSGVGIYDGASANTVNANVISANIGHGLDIAFSAANNTATANTIGTGVNRTTPLGNVGAGVLVNFSSSNSTIGGSTVALGNFVANNGTGGIVVGNGSSGARIFANTVSGNTGSGIEINNSASAIVGLASPPNIVTDNTGDGIRLTGAGTTGTLVQGNFVGVIPNGTVARPNGGAGVAILNGATGTDVGGTSVGNVIAGNTGDGVFIDNADNNLVRGNRIGQTGLSTGFFPNGGAGVSVNDATGIRIGSPATSELNIIARNLGDGIEVTGNSTVNARGNIIEGNSGLGLDLGGNGVTANDLDDNDTGANTLLNFPTLTTYTRTSNGNGFDHSVAGTYSGAPNTSFTIDLYANAAQDASGFGEGQFLIQSFSVTTDDDGDATFTRAFTTGATNIFGSPLGAVLTSQATLGNGSTGPSSEFSNALGGTPPVTSDALFFTAQALGSRVEIRKAGNGELVRSFSAFNPAFKGGIRIANGDVNGDGFNDVITATGDGGGARVRVFDGHNTTAGRPTVLYDFFPYGNGYRGGLYVAAGDVDGDGKAEIIVAPSAGASGLVKVFSGADGSLHTSFLAFGRGAGGVRVAAGDVNGDGRADIIAGTGAGSIVRVFDGQNPANILKEFRAFPVAYRGGVTVAAGDVDGDGLADIIVGAGAGSNAVRTFFSRDAGGMVEFNAFPGAGRGVNVAAVDFNGDGIADIIAAQARFAAPKIRIYDGTSVLTGGTSAPLIRNAFTFDPAYLGGVFVG